MENEKKIKNEKRRMISKKHKNGDEKKEEDLTLMRWKGKDKEETEEKKECEEEYELKK